MRALALLLALVPATAAAEGTLVVASKNFTEQVIVAEMISIIAEENVGLTVERKFNLGGTFFCLEALKNGEVDVYPEYTGTAYVAVLERQSTPDRALVWKTVTTVFKERWDLEWLPPFEFNNTYTLTVTRPTAEKLGLKTISDLVPHAKGLLMGCTHEFIERQDGLPGLKATYGLEFGEVRALDPGLTYRAAKEGEIDVCDAYATDGRIKAYDLIVLEDDKQFFPPYQAAPLIRSATLKKYPKLRAELSKLGGLLSDDEMRALNHAVDSEGHPAATIARDFLIDNQIIAGEKKAAGASTRGGLWSYLWSRRGYLAELTAAHLELTGIAVLIAVFVGLPFGIMLTRYRRMVPSSMMVINIIQTVPSLALLGFTIPLLGIGALPAIVALFLYALLPVIRNTYTGIVEVDPTLVEAARGLGMTHRQVLFNVELPLALPIIMAGVRTATVINIGTATLAALIGAGGLGEPIFRGIAMVNANVILSGAIPAALLALFADFALGRIEHLLGPRKAA